MKYFNKKILITGASSGLGKTLAKSYAKEGGTVINLSRNIEKMKSLNHDLNILHKSNHQFFSVDVSKYDDILKIKNELKYKNMIPDIVVNNAAGNFLCPIEKISKNGWNRSSNRASLFIINFGSLETSGAIC